MDPVYRPIPATAKYTGLAECFIRKGVKDGTIPAIKVGKKYMVNVPLLLENLNAEIEARANG